MQREITTVAIDKAKSKQLTNEQQKLVIRYYNIVYTFFKEHNLDYKDPNNEDLLSDMNEALCHAAATYNPDKNVQFTSYAWDCMENAWKDSIKMINRQKRIPKEKIYSLNEPLYNGESEDEYIEYGELLQSENNTENSAIFSVIFDECIKMLSNRESLIIQLYIQGRTVKEISQILQCTESCVYKVSEKFVKSIKDAFC